MEIYNLPHLALWKSAGVAVVNRQAGYKKSKRAIDIDHPLQKAADQYSEQLYNNKPIPTPDTSKGPLSADDPQIGPYLSFLHHQLAHARIAGDKKLENELETQRGRFKYGNPLWEQQMIQYFWYYWDYPFHKGQAPHYRSWQDKKYGNGDINYGAIKWKIPARATIALVGDIGTGTDFAAAVLVSALKFNPDVILHVGDVYYSGTKEEFNQRFVGMINDVMKDYGRKVPVFTIPGNHEYFTGAISFLNCIDSMQLVNTEDQRQATSYFSIQTEDNRWQFLGMDTSFYGHYMDVPANAQEAALALLHHQKVEVPVDPTDPHWPNAYNPIFRHCKDANIPVKDPTVNPTMTPVRTDEQQWHAQKLNEFTGRTILLSHHQVYSAKQQIGVQQKQVAGSNGVSVPDSTDINRAWVNTALWNQFNPWLSTKVAAWFWGHEHNLCIYKDGYLPDGYKAPDTLNAIAKGRCIGHSGIPVQETETPYQQAYPVPLINNNVELSVTDGWYNNGYQILKLQGGGMPIKTAYYQLAGADPTPLLIFEEDII
jgi:predicted phosphodiesterase